MQHRVVALTGQEARKVFFNEPALDFNEGYKILMGGAPLLENIDESLQAEGNPTNAEFLRRMLLIMRKDAIAESESHIIIRLVFSLSQRILFDTSITSSRTSFSHRRR